MHICCFSEPWQRPCPPGRWTAAAPALQPLEFGTHLLPFLQIPAGDSLTDRASYSFCQRLLQPCMIGANIVLHPAIGLRMRLFQRHNTRCSRPDNNSSKFLAISTPLNYIFCLFCQSPCTVPLVGRVLPGLYVPKDKPTFAFAALPLLAATTVSYYPVPGYGTRFSFTMGSLPFF